MGTQLPLLGTEVNTMVQILILSALVAVSVAMPAGPPAPYAPPPPLTNLPPINLLPTNPRNFPHNLSLTNMELRMTTLVPALTSLRPKTPRESFKANTELLFLMAEPKL